MSEKDSSENLKEETSYKDENEQEAEELGSNESDEEREQELEPVPMTRKRPEPKPPSQPVATEKPTAEVLKVCSCAHSEQQVSWLYAQKNLDCKPHVEDSHCCLPEKKKLHKSYVSCVLSSP